jgi:hypothetical protein
MTSGAIDVQAILPRHKRPLPVPMKKSMLPASKTEAPDLAAIGSSSIAAD